MANVWMTGQEMQEDFPLVPEVPAQYLDKDGNMVDFLGTMKTSAYDRGVGDTTCDMSWWTGGGQSGNSRWIVRYNLPFPEGDMPDGAGSRLVTVRYPLYMRNVTYLDIAFLAWVDLGYVRSTALSTFNDVSGVIYNKDGVQLKLYCIPTQGNDHPGTARIAEGQYGPGFVPFHFVYDDEENPTNIDFIEFSFTGVYTERTYDAPYAYDHISTFWVVQPCYNDDAEFVNEPEPPVPVEQETNQGPVTPARAGGQGTFTSITINRGDRAGNYVGDITDTREDNLAKAFNNPFSKVYCFDNVNDSQLGSIFGELYGTDYWGLFTNLQLNPLSCILNFHLIPSTLRGENLTLENLVIGPKDFTHDSEGAIPQVITCKTLRKKHVGDIDVSNVFTHYFDAFPDFEPYTKAILHLPFIGDINIDINAVMYGTLSVDYVCDNINGNVAAWVWCEDRDGRATYKYIATGNCSYSIPLWAQSQNGLDVGKIVGSGIGLVGGALTGNIAAVVGGAMGIGSTLYQQSREPIHTQHTGGSSGNVSYLGDHVCWLEVVRPQWVNVDEFNVDEPYKHGVGLPEIVRGTIASNNLINHLSVSWVDLTNLTAATPEELEEIESLLKSGILINKEEE